VRLRGEVSSETLREWLGSRAGDAIAKISSIRRTGVIDQEVDGALQGWADTQKGEATTGIARIRDGLAALEATGTRLSAPFDLALLAAARICRRFSQCSVSEK
jgi:hypothetical protein